MARRLPIPNGRLDGALDANGMRIVNLSDPLSDDDAATKGYVDRRAGSGAAGSGAVASVNDKTGAVVLTGEDIQVGGGDSRFVVEAIHDNEKSVYAHVTARGNPHGLTAVQIGAVVNTDSRLTDARTPKSHAASHGVRGSDPVTPESIDAIPNGGSAAGLRVGKVILDGASLCLGYDSWGGEVPGGGSWDQIRRYIEESGEVETLPGYLAANYAAADQVEAIAESVSTDNRFLVDGTSAAIQTRESEDAEWSDEIRLDKGYDALQGDAMVKLDKSVQTVTVAGGTLTVVLPDAVEGTVRDLCLYVNNTSATETVTMVFPNGVTAYKTKGGDDPKAAAQAGGLTGYYFTEIPGGAWRVFRDELEVVA